MIFLINRTIINIQFASGLLHYAVCFLKLKGPVLSIIIVLICVDKSIGTCGVSSMRQY